MKTWIYLMMATAVGGGTACGDRQEAFDPEGLNLESTGGDLRVAKMSLLDAPGSASPSLDEWAFAWASSSDQDHTSPSDYSRTSNGNVQAQIDHQGTGRYRVTFPGVGQQVGGNVIVSSYGSDNNRCKVAGWSSSSSGLNASVYCFGPDGTARNASFTIAYHRQHSYNFGETAYLWADQPSTSQYVPSESYQYNSNGSLNGVERLGAGNYRVRLPGFIIPLGNAQVSAYGTGSEHCKMHSVGRYFNERNEPIGRELYVRCYASNGAAVDTRFTLHYQTMGTSLGTTGAWTRSNQSQATEEYSARDDYTEHNSCGADTSTEVRISRLSTGRYRVAYPHTPGTLATSLVTAFGSNNHYCKVRSWSNTGSGANVYVDCYDDDGALVDSNFMSHHPSARSCPTTSDVVVAVTAPLESNQWSVQRIGPESRTGPTMDRISGFVELSNNGSASKFLERIDIEGVPVAWFWTPREILAGGSINVQNAIHDVDGDGLLDALPLIVPNPHSNRLSVEAFFTDGTRATAESPTLSNPTNDGGPLLFTGNAFDLMANETWSSSSNHGSGHQVFALDMGVMGWNWNNNNFSFFRYPGADGAQKHNTRIYGMPVYSMAAGQVCYALNDHSERSFPDTTLEQGMSPTRLVEDPGNGGYNGGGNEVFIVSGNEITAYAHLQPGSIPAELLTPGASVQRGQYLGKVGLSGNTSGPHLHIHTKTRPSGVPTSDVRRKYGCDEGQPVPVHFQYSKTLPLSDANARGATGALDDGDFTTLPQGNFPHPYSLMMPSQDDLDFDRNRTEGGTYFGVYQSGSHIEMRVKSNDWTAFTQRWNTLSLDGFRLFEVETVVEDGSRKFLGLFRRGNFGHSLLAMTGYSEFRSLWVEQRAAGLRLVDIEVYNSGSAEVFIGVFHADGVEQDFRLVEGWTAFAADFGQRHAAGFRLVDVATLPGASGRRYFGVYRQGGPVQNLLGVPGWLEFADANGDQFAQRMRLLDLEAYREGGQEHFIGVFGFGDQGMHLKRMEGYGQYVAESEQSGSVGLRAVDVVALDD